MVGNLWWRTNTFRTLALKMFFTQGKTMLSVSVSQPCLQYFEEKKFKRKVKLTKSCWAKKQLRTTVNMPLFYFYADMFFSPSNAVLSLVLARQVGVNDSRSRCPDSSSTAMSQSLFPLLPAFMKFSCRMMLATASVCSARLVSPATVRS